LPMPIEKSAAKNFVAADSEFRQQKLCHCWFRNGQPNYAAAGSEIDSQKLCRCRFRIQQQWWSHFDFTSFFLCLHHTIKVHRKTIPRVLIFWKVLCNSMS
jgi:hypothetical protein